MKIIPSTGSRLDGNQQQGLPECDLVVSPQHRIVLDTLEGGECFVPAKSLAGINGIRILTEVDSVDYHHVALPRHAVIFAGGLRSESFYPGRNGFGMLSPSNRLSLLLAFPQLRPDSPEDSYGPLCLPTLNVREGRELARALVAAGRSLQQSPRAQSLGLSA